MQQNIIFKKCCVIGAGISGIAVKNSLFFLKLLKLRFYLIKRFPDGLE